MLHVSRVRPPFVGSGDAGEQLTLGVVDLEVRRRLEPDVVGDEEVEAEERRRVQDGDRQQALDGVAVVDVELRVDDSAAALDLERERVVGAGLGPRS